MNKKSWTSLIAGLLAALTTVIAVSQESSEPFGPVQSTNGTETPSKLHVKGVLISESGRTTLVNNVVLREGDRIGGATILAIEEKVVRILAGSNEVAVPIGSSTRVPTSASARQASHRAEYNLITRVSKKRRTKRDVAFNRSVAVPDMLSEIVTQRRTVKSGETLSEIAQDFLTPGLTANQVMIALFTANPSAFDGDIHSLKKGAILRIPTDSDIRGQSLEAAMAEVARQANTWETNHQRSSMNAKSQSTHEYGPVQRGETLSAIAVRVKQSDVTMNQMMIALFHANQHAFNGNINLLNEGATLRIPDDSLLYDRTPASATADVLHQTKAWRCHNAKLDVACLTPS